MTTELPPFEGFPSIPRLYRDCIITEKLDGTNAQIYVPDDASSVHAASKSRWIEPGDDNEGFAYWVEKHAEELIKGLGPGKHAGEWWGTIKGSSRKYNLKEKRFSLFNTSRWTAENLPSCCSVVPILAKGKFSSQLVDETMAKLKETGSIASPGFMNPEGVVVFMVQPQYFFKVTFEGDGHKGAK